MFKQYKSRKIEFRKVFKINDWEVKAYTITIKDNFQSELVFDKVITELPNWLKSADQSDLPHYKVAFLIFHEARDGNWILLNWWTGGEMLQTVIYFSNINSPLSIIPTPYSNGLRCIWEIEIIFHERCAWINNVLEKASRPNFESYLKDIYKEKEEL